MAKEYQWPLAAGFMGMVMLSMLYLGIVSLAQGFEHAAALFWEDKALVIPIILGFGAQVGLYTLLRRGPSLAHHVPAGGATTAAGGGMSTVAMVACCAHHVADVMPLLGLTAAATLLANWKVPFMVVGLATNLVGIAYMVRALLRARSLSYHAQPVLVEPAP